MLCANASLRGKRVDVFYVQIKTERIAAGHQPACDCGVEVKLPAATIGQYAIARLATCAHKPQPGVKGFAGKEPVSAYEK